MDRRARIFAVYVALFFATSAAATADKPSCEYLFLRASSIEKRDQASLNARSRLLKTIVLGNVMMPQTEVGIQISIFTAVLNDPQLLPELLRPYSLDEISDAADKMNRAHAAYGIKYRTEGHPDAQPGKIVQLERILSLANGFQRVSLGSLRWLAYSISPEDSEVRRSYWEKESPEKNAYLLAFYTVHQADLQNPETVMGRLRLLFTTVMRSGELADFNKQRLEKIRMVMSRHDRLTQSDQARLEFELFSKIRYLYLAEADKLFPESQAEELKKFFTFGVGD